MDLLKLVIAVLFCFSTICCVDLPYRTFRCLNGTYIEDRLICDRKVDCVQPNDGLDESSRLCTSDQQKFCGPGKFACPRKNSGETVECRKLTDLCNTISECHRVDNQILDEMNCGDEIQVHNCTLNHEKFLCDDGLRCLNIQDTCDGVCNCFDCSDEKTGCTVDDELSKSSHQACFKTPNGPFCCSGNDSLCKECDPGHLCDQKCAKFANEEKCYCEEKYIGLPGTYNAKCVVHRTKDPHSEDEPDESSNRAPFIYARETVYCSQYTSWCQRCETPDICDQKCIKLDKEMGCFCEENYFGAPGTNNRKCFPRFNAGKEKLLLLTQRSPNAIIVKNLFTDDTSTVYVKDITGVDCEPYLITAAREYIYFAASNCSGFQWTTIFKTTLTKNSTQKIIESNSNLTTLAVDWITDNVYYSTNSSLSVCDDDGESCEELKSGMDIRHLALAPRFGLMFWIFHNADEENYHLIRSSMDGSKEYLLLRMINDTEKIFFADESSERIYWFARNENAILSMNFDGEYNTSVNVKLLDLEQFDYRFISFDRSTLRLRNYDSTYYAKNPWIDIGTIFENEIFFIEPTQEQMSSLEKIYSNTLITNQYRDLVPDITSTLTKPNFLNTIKSIYVYNPLLHRTQIANPCSSCDGLCLTRPSSYVNILDHSCSSGVRTSVISIGIVFGVIMAVWLV